MTAVALLFSIYQVQPSPFCVLDEWDAPLDHSNIDRFLGKLKSFLKHSQFLIITHNKRTIGVADVLYGVTMQERGVSRVVSVKFHDRSSRSSIEPEVNQNGFSNGDETSREDEEIVLAKKLAVSCNYQTGCPVNRVLAYWVTSISLPSRIVTVRFPADVRFE